MAIDIKPEEIRKLSSEWRHFYKDNDKDGNSVTSFMAGRQWSARTIQERMSQGKETLTLDMVLRLYYRIIGDYCSVDYTLGVTPQMQRNPKEIGQAEEILRAIFLNQENRNVFGELFGALVSYGYSVAFIGTKYARLDDPQLLPCINRIRPELSFFDPGATLDTKQDGKYCGIARHVSAQSLKKSYPKYRSNTFAVRDASTFGSKDHVVVFDFFYKQEEKEKFFRVPSGGLGSDKWKPKSEMTAYELTLPLLEYYERDVPKVYSMRCTNEQILQEPQLYHGLTVLPLIFFGSPFFVYGDEETDGYTMERGLLRQITVPLIKPAVDAQQLLNNASSQIATQISKKTESSWIYAKETLDENDANVWRDANSTAGLFPYKSMNDRGTEQLPPPSRVEPLALDPVLLQVMQLAKQMIDEAAGVNLSQQGSSEDGAQSGVALAQRITQGNLVQKKVFGTFIKGLNCVGNAIKEMSALLIRDPYELPYQKGKQSEMTFLKLNGEDSMAMRDVHNAFSFTIEATPSSQLEMQRSAETYLTLLKLDPNIAGDIIDLAVENLDINNVSELQRRLRAKYVSRNLDAVGKGDIDIETYDKREAELQQQAAQNAPPDPLVMDVQERARSNQERAQIDIQKLKQEYEIAKEKLEIEKAKLILQAGSAERDSRLRAIDTQQRNLDRLLNGR